MQEFDIAIVGGGLVGASLAHCLSGSGLRTVVIDQQPAEELYKADLDNRGLALAYSSVKILQCMNLWPKLVPHAHKIKTVHVSEQGKFGFTRLDAEQQKIAALGYVLPASVLGSVLLKDLASLKDIHVLRPASIRDLDYAGSDSSWHFEVGTESIRTQLLVAADGTNSYIRKHLNIAVNKRDTQQTALVCNLQLEQNHADTAFERFIGGSVLALLPFGGKRIKCVWTVQNSDLATMQSLTDLDFIKKIQTEFGMRLGKILAISERMAFPIQNLHTEQVHAQNCVLIGNAANTLHPVAAQGFNLGLRDAYSLAQNLKQGNDLSAYSLDRINDHKRTRFCTNTLVDLFANQSTLAKLSRRLAILAAQFIPSLNRKILQTGAGLCI